MERTTKKRGGHLMSSGMVCLGSSCPARLASLSSTRRLVADDMAVF
ncbi:hypothetical protein [Stieleria bergensis]